MECLNIFGGAPGHSFVSLKMYYPGEGEPLGLVLEEGGVVTECQIKTMEADEILDFNFAKIQHNIFPCVLNLFYEREIKNKVHILEFINTELNYLLY